MGWLDALCNSAGGILNNMNAKRWLITYGIGACCGIIAYCVATSTSVLLRTKFSVFNSFIEKEKTGEVPYGTAFLFYLMSNVIFGYIAWFVVFIEPSAKGSGIDILTVFKVSYVMYILIHLMAYWCDIGIPEIKCFLNGIDVDGIVDMKTLWFKMVGIVFSVSSGLPLGKEGPMVHAGAIVAASISQGYCCEGCLKCCAQKTPTGRRENGGMFSDFKNDKEKRDFVTCGTGAGLAAAFGAPIGGVLFALEEASSFWSTKLTWKSFFCAMTSVFTAMFLSSMGSRVGEYAMFSFGEFYSLTGEIANYSMWELFVFLMIGAAGGVLGALFVRCNSYICKYRKATIVTDKQRLLEVLLVVIGFTCISFLLPLFWNSCSRIPTEVAQWTEQERQLASQLVPLYCKQGSEYNELGSLFLTDGDTAIKQLFHFKELGNGQDDSTIRGSALLMFFVVYVAVFCITCGLTMAAGMFVPSLLAGACFGRIVGHLLHVFDASHGTFADAGTYALMGAAAFTSGITRITISLSIMILEATGDMQYVLPLMITTLTAQYVGNVCSVGMDDMKIESMSFPYLVEEEQLGNDHNGRYDRSVGCEGVTDIMSKNVVVLEPVVSVEHVLSVLRTHKHNCFPVVVRNNSHGNANTNANIGESEEEGDSRIFLGTISRDILCSLLLHKAYTTPLKTDSGTNTVWGAKSNSRSSAIETDEYVHTIHLRVHYIRNMLTMMLLTSIPCL